MGAGVTTLLHRRLDAERLRELIVTAPGAPGVLGDDHRRALGARFRAVAGTAHRRLDAWSVERAGAIDAGFRWSSSTARRVLGNAGLRRAGANPSLTLVDAVRDEVTDHLLRAAAGHARPGSLGHWLAATTAGERGAVVAEAVNWATHVVEATQYLELDWRPAESDAYYDVAGARTTLRGRRDLVIARGDVRVLVRFRTAGPGKSAGPGLRSDLTIDALAHREGRAAARMIGVWPEAGVMLAVDGTMDDLRAGARDLVRTAVVLERRRGARAA